MLLYNTMNFFSMLWRCDPTRVMASSFLRFVDQTQRRSTVGSTPLDEWSARHRDLYLTTHNTHNRQISMPPVGFEPTISAGEQPQTYSLDRATTGTGILQWYWIKSPYLFCFIITNLSPLCLSVTVCQADYTRMRVHTQTHICTLKFLSLWSPVYFVDSSVWTRDRLPTWLYLCAYVYLCPPIQ